MHGATEGRVDIEIDAWLVAFRELTTLQVLGKRRSNQQFICSIVWLAFLYQGSVAPLRNVSFGACRRLSVPWPEFEIEIE